MDLHFLHVCLAVARQSLCRYTCLPRFWILPGFHLPILQFCPSLQWRWKTQLCLDDIVQFEPIIHKRLPELLQTSSVVNLALALGFAFGHVRHVLSSKWLFFALHASEVKGGIMYVCPPITSSGSNCQYKK